MLREESPDARVNELSTSKMHSFIQVGKEPFDDNQEAGVTPVYQSHQKHALSVERNEYSNNGSVINYDKFLNLNDSLIKRTSSQQKRRKASQEGSASNSNQRRRKTDPFN